jgi:hypothetical protein
MENNQSPQFLPPGGLVHDGRYFGIILDSSTSMRRVRADGTSLFSLQLEELSRCLSGLRQGRQRFNTSVLFNSFAGCVKPGWQSLLDPSFAMPSESDLPVCTESPVLDITGGTIALLNHLYVQAALEGKEISCGILIITDAREGYRVKQGIKPVSSSSLETTALRIKQHVHSNFVCNVLAIGEDNGASVAAFFSSLGVPQTSIYGTGVSASEFRRSFKDVSERSLGALYEA